MDKLEALVNSLEKLPPREKDDKIVKKLQEILELFLRNYYVEFGAFKIDPILVEAYYYNDKQNFKDESVHAARNEKGKIATHARERQKNNFGKLYIHNVITKDDGLDVCLSKGDYYFSILIKNAIINDKDFATQSNVSKIICDKCQGCNEVPSCLYYQECVLKKREQPKNDEIIFVKRKGLKNSYADKPLAALPINKIKVYSFTAGESSTKIVKAYIEKQISMKDYDEEKLKGLATGLIDWKTFEKK